MGTGRRLLLSVTLSWEISPEPGSTVASIDENPLKPGRRKRFLTEEETTLDLSDEEEEVVESLSALAVP
jgi:hypothetical protein